MGSTAAPPTPARDRLLAGLAAGLPARGIWTAPAVVAVSGGADSTALLLGLVALAPPPARLVVAHAEHDLRVTAGADREFVTLLAGRLGLTYVCRRLAVRDADDPTGEGIEARARRLRYRFLEEVAHEHGARHVLVAHTADDQAETILHRILRGTGPAGLAGMPAARQLCDGVGLLRPLLAVDRSDVREFLVAEAEAWREDESNTDVRFARNFLRHEVLARCMAGPYPAAAGALVRLGRQAGQLATALRSAAAQLLDAHARGRADGAVELWTGGLAGLDLYLLAEMFAALWEREGGPRRDMTAAHYERLAACVGAADASATGITDYPGGVRVSARAGMITAFRHPQAGVLRVGDGCDA
jgi:tRNA(Ile)-lysidine synthase